MNGMMKDNYVDEILYLMRGRQLAYPNVYDATNRIMDLNFYNNFKDRYADLRKLADFNGMGFDKLSPYPYNKSWTKTKRILAVMNVEVKHFLAVEILLYEGKIKVYDFNLPVFNEDTFLAHMQPFLKLLPKLLTQSKLMDHLPAEVLMKESWNFEGKNKSIELPKNKIGVAYGWYSLVYTKCLLIDTEMTDIYDAIMGNIQWVWAYGVLTKWLEPCIKRICSKTKTNMIIFFHFKPLHFTLHVVVIIFMSADS
ncbi:hypothetical protein P3L10_016000 [Capsicum annuum]